ncbi:MAG TPA: M28 family peptidase [Solirubrobacteraceae bacterium]
MLNARLYRAALVPFLFALAIAAFSLGTRPLPLSSTLAPDAFEGRRAFAEMQALAARYPDRRPGSAGDQALAEHVAATLRGLGGGFSVHLQHVEGQTIDGERTLTNVIAQRPGSTNASPIVIVAHRDAAAPGSEAELSGTAALLELARVFAARETKRTIVLVSTSGGSGGDAGASGLAPSLRGAADGVIVIGDVAAANASRPEVVAYSDGFGSAPLALARTVSDAITHELGADPGSPSALGQLAHLALPMAAGEQGVLNAAGVPAVLVQASGERGPAPRERVSAERVEGLGRSVLSAVDALDTAPDVSSAMQTGLVLARKTLPLWAVQLLVGTALLAPLIAAADGLARLRRRRMPVGRWTLWTLSCALPFFSCALFAFLLGGAGVLGAAPAVPVPPSAMPIEGTAATVLIAVALSFLLAWLLWSMLVRRLHWGTRPDGEVAGLAVLLVLIPVALVVWASNPFAALLLVPATHLWLLLASPELRPRRVGAIALVAGGLLPLILLVAFFGHQLGLGVGGVAWTAVLMLAGGHIGLGGAVLWSAALGCAAAASLLALRPQAAPPGPQVADGIEVTIRGPMSYAGPGSLGGTESALRR